MRILTHASGALLEGRSPGHDGSGGIRPGGDTTQWQPNLFNDTRAIYSLRRQSDLEPDTAMADDAIHWMKELNDIDPSMPFFRHYVPGGTHAPHHPRQNGSRSL